MHPLSSLPLLISILSSIFTTPTHSSCHHSTSHDPALLPRNSPDTFNYDQVSLWPYLHPLCGHTTQQSPINILPTTNTLPPREHTPPDPKPHALHDPQLANLDVDLTLPTLNYSILSNLGTTLSVAATQGTLVLSSTVLPPQPQPQPHSQPGIPSLTPKSKSASNIDLRKRAPTAKKTVYALKQFHFHTPSEHRIDGAWFVGEIHFVFESTDGTGRLAVVAFLMDLACVNEPLIAAVLENLEGVGLAGDVGETGRLEFAALERRIADGNVFRYSGSLTTPPCSEGVEWIVGLEPLGIDSQTFMNLKKVLGWNSRGTQR